MSSALNFSASLEFMAFTGCADCETGPILSDTFAPIDKLGEVRERGIGVGRKVDCGTPVGNLGVDVGEDNACAFEPLK